MAADKAAHCGQKGGGTIEVRVRTYDSKTAAMGVSFTRSATKVVAMVATALARPSAVK